MSPDRVSVGEEGGDHSMQRHRRRKRLGNQHGGELVRIISMQRFIGTGSDHTGLGRVQGSCLLRQRVHRCLSLLSVSTRF